MMDWLTWRKPCAQCTGSFGREEYSRDRHRPDGMTAWCRVCRALVTHVHSPQCVDIKVFRQAPHKDAIVKRVPVATERRRGCAMRGGLNDRLREEFGR